MIIFLQVALAPILYFLIKWLIWLLFEKTSWPPRWLAYKPFGCLICCTFWTQIFMAVALLSIGLKITSLIVTVLAILDAVAMKIDEKNKTVSLEEFNKIEKLEVNDLSNKRN